MDTNLTLALEALASSGFVIPSEQRAALHLSLAIKKKKAGLSSLSLWGRVMTANGKDYLLACGCNGMIRQEGRLVVDKKSYYSQDGVKWMDLQTLSDDIYEACKSIRGCFTGEPSHLYSVAINLVEGAKQENEGKLTQEALEKSQEAEKDVGAKKKEDDEEDEDYNKEDVDIRHDDEEDQEEPSSDEVSKKTLKSESKTTFEIRELERLAALIQQVDYECGVVPRGALIFNAMKQLVRNTFFSGVQFVESLDSYAHLFQGYEDALLSKDITGSWSIEVFRLTNDALLRSLWWPGYVFYYTSSTKDFGSMYFGTGEKNFSLPFMI